MLVRPPTPLGCVKMAVILLEASRYPGHSPHKAFLWSYPLNKCKRQSTLFLKSVIGLFFFCSPAPFLCCLFIILLLTRGNVDLNPNFIFLCCVCASNVTWRRLEFSNNLLEIFVPEVWNFSTWSRFSLSILSVSRSLISTLVYFLGYVDTLSCDLIALAVGLAVFLVIILTPIMKPSSLSYMIYSLLNFTPFLSLCLVSALAKWGSTILRKTHLSKCSCSTYLLLISGH